VFFLAGYDTTANMLACTLYELAVNPDVQRLYEEIQDAKREDAQLSFDTIAKLEYMDAVLCEVLRKYCPSVSVGRESCDEYYILKNKLTVPKGTILNILQHAIHYCEEYFPDPH